MKKEQKRLFGFLQGHYHWVIAAVLFTMLFTHGGMNNNFVTLYLMPISERLSISRSTFSLVFSLKGIVAMLSTFVSGFIISKYGSRLSLSVGLVITCIAYVFFARAESLTMLAISSILLGLSYGFCTISAAVVILRLWFHRHEGTVLGIVSAATGAGGSLFGIVQTAVMEANTYRASLYLCAVMIFVVMILVLLLVRNRPESMGLTALGEGEKTAKRPKAELMRFPGLPMEALWKQPAFYLMIFATVLCNFALYLAFNVLRNFFIDSGFSVTQATGLYSAMLLLLTFTKLFSGALCDRLGARRVTLICAAFGAAGLLTLSLMQNFYTAVLAVVLYTASLPLMTLLGPLLASNLFGYRAQMQYTGVLVSSVSLANLGASYVTNLIYDICHSYRPSFLLAVILVMVSWVLFLILYRAADRLKAKTSA